MSDYAYDNVQVVVQHQPDSSMEQGPDGNKVRTELPGHYQVGVLLDGAFLPISAPMNRGTVDAQIAAAKAQQEQTTDAQASGTGVAEGDSPPPPEGQSSQQG